MATSISRPALIRRIGVAVSLIAGLLLAIAWLERRHIATDLVDRRLAAAGVRGSYRIVGLGPVSQVIEDVRLGDPGQPDLVAARMELRWRYRLGLPELASVRATGVRLSGRWRDGRLSLGSLDRLIPRSTSGKPGLPDLVLQLSDVTLALLTPAGMMRARLDGSGNPTHDFAGILQAQTAALAAVGCAMDGATATLRVRTGPAGTQLSGPIATGQSVCTIGQLGRGQAEIDVRIAPALDRAQGNMMLAGYGGTTKRVRFGPVRGTMGFTATRAEVEGRADLGVRDLVLSQLRADGARVGGHYRIRSGGSAFAGDVALIGASAAPTIIKTVAAVARATDATPLGPIAARLDGRLSGLLRRSNLQAMVTLGKGAVTEVRITRAQLTSLDGAELLLAGSFDRARSGGWVARGRVGGSDLPSVFVQAERIAPAGGLEALVISSPYRAGRATLVLDPVRLRAQAGTIRIVTRATLSGPFKSGTIEGLVLPIAFTFTADGGASVDAGCVDVSARRVSLTSLTLDPARVRLCGEPMLTVSPQGTVRVDARVPGLALTGRSGNAPLRIDSGPVILTRSEVTAQQVSARLGAGPDPTRLAIGTLVGHVDAHGPGGRFAEAAGAIANVPLALSGGKGTWTVERGALQLRGALAIADRNASPRFAKLASPDVALSLADGHISASGTLVPKGRPETVAAITLRHDLDQGRGAADIAVKGVTFARAGLQPEMLTPLTLGVVANVAGTINGDGRIDWSRAGTTSSGTFRTDRIDLAAAFGPVTGLSGVIRFTDLLGLVTAPHQEVRMATINPGVAVTDGIVRYQLPGADLVAVEDGDWPFAGGTLTLEPALLDFSAAAERRLTFRLDGLDAAAFIQQLDFPNIAATGTFDGRLPMVFGQEGGRIEMGGLRSRGGGTLAYVGPLTNAQLGTMGKIAFDALKAIRYSRLDLALDGKLDGEIVTRVGFDGVRQGPGTRGLVARAIRNLPFRFNIAIRAPFRALVGTAASYADPSLLLQQVKPAAVQPPDSAAVR